MKMLVDLPDQLKPGMKIKSRHGALGIVGTKVRDPHKTDSQGNPLYKRLTARAEAYFRMKFEHNIGGRHFTMNSDTIWSREDLVKAGCRQRLSKREAMQYALTH